MIFQKRLGLAVGAVVFFLILFHLQSVGFTTRPLTSSPSTGNAQNGKPEASTSSPGAGDGKQSPSNSNSGSDSSRIVVIASTKEEEVGWLQEELPDVPKAIYRVDDPTAEYTVPANKGHESMVYLTYLIDHYDKLPDVMIFLHAHRIAWHNNDLLGSDAAQMIAALSSPYVQRQGYVNMRCHWDPGCPEWMHPFNPSNRTDISKPEERELAKAFVEIFPGRPVPETMATACCAQFALSKEIVQKIPLEDLKSWRNWILNTPLPDVISGRVWEYLWQYVFSGDAVVCPRMDLCYCDGFGVCFGGDDKYTAWFDNRNDMRKVQSELKELEKLEEKKKKENQGLSTDELRQKAELERKIGDVQKDLQDRLSKAKERGKNPKFRAQDSGRAYRDGEGF